MKADCPPSEELLALATDDQASTTVREHVARCTECQIRVDVLNGEVAELRSLSSQKTPALGKTCIPGVKDSPLLPNAATIGRYVIVGELGSGGQADVYRVIDPSLGRDLVLKLSRRKTSDGKDRWDALLAEGRLLAGLDHPGLVRIFDVGIHDSRPYLVLEHVSGRNLEQCFVETRPSAQEAARLVAEVAHVVAYAHRRGVMHGDITPRNILIDGHGRPRLIDFGLSKIESAWGENPGLIGGTPEFLPPEVVRAGARMGRTGAAADVFGLGATLYWLLTGEAPFSAPTTTEALARAQQCDIDFDALQRDRVPKGLARICRRALATDPADRPPPQVLAEALDRFARRWSSRRVIVTAVALLLAMSGLFFWRPELAETDPRENTTFLLSSPLIHVMHPDGIRTLSNELPLRTGDRLAISCNLSPGQHATMFWFNAAGELKTLTPSRDVVDTLDRLVYPAPDRFIALERPEGTDLIFFCRGDPVAEATVRTCFPMGHPVPRIPAHNWLTLQRSDVRTEGPLKSTIPPEIIQVKAILKEINRKLRRYYPQVTGIAFPHQAAEAAK